MELCLDHVSKEFKDKKAVDDVSLRISPGVWGLLGANGAGKTTLMRMIAGILKPASGQITYDGIRIEALGEAYRDIFGYLPQEFGFYPEFTVKDYLEYIAALKGLTKNKTNKKIAELLETLRLYEVRKKSGDCPGIAERAGNPDSGRAYQRVGSGGAGSFPESAFGVCP